MLPHEFIFHFIIRRFVLYWHKISCNMMRQNCRSRLHCVLKGTLLNSSTHLLNWLYKAQAQKQDWDGRRWQFCSSMTSWNLTWSRLREKPFRNEKIMDRNTLKVKLYQPDLIWLLLSQHTLNNEFIVF